MTECTKQKSRGSPSGAMRVSDTDSRGLSKSSGGRKNAKHHHWTKAPPVHRRTGVRTGATVVWVCGTACAPAPAGPGILPRDTRSVSLQRTVPVLGMSHTDVNWRPPSVLAI